MLLDRVCAVVDLETTGSNANRSSITEVGALLLDPDGSEYEFQRLVNPYCKIPAFIESLTGINNAMVANQPGFEDLAVELWNLINDTVFIAHNARFDYAFLKQAFANAGYKFRPPIICTVKLARKLFPEWDGYSLGAIIERIGFEASDRHRAMADVESTVAFIRYAIEKHGLEAVNAAAEAQLGKASIPRHLDAEKIDAIPDFPGVYYFYGEDDSLLYVGKSKTLRTRIKSHFGADVRDAKEMRMAQEVRAVEHRLCAGELGALLLENHDIKTRQPVYNRRQRPQKKLWCVFLVADKNDYLRAELSHHAVADSTPAETYGLYSSRSAANTALRKLADDNALCKKLLGLEKGNGPCFAYQLKKCDGACTGQESEQKHNARLLSVLNKKRIETWPFDCDIAVHETSPEQGITDVHIVSNWAYKGTFRFDHDSILNDGLERPNASLKSQAEKLVDVQLGFDKDTYRILHKFLVRERHAGLEIVPLADASTGKRIDRTLTSEAEA